MSSKVKSAISTALFCGVVILLMIFVSAYSFDPAEYREEHPPKIPPEGFEVSLGEPDRGRGDEPAPSANQHSSTKASSSTSQPKTPTQKSGAGKVDKSDKPVTTSTTESQEPTINQNALYKGKTTTPGGNNTANGSGLGETKTLGNQGLKGGDPDSRGIDGVVGGRKIKDRPKDSYTSTRAGTVVITLSVTVDVDGNVKNAEFSKASVYDESLIKKAIQLAEQAKFYPAADASVGDQRGKITVTFKNTK